MYINYINDRKELGFSCTKDVNAIRQLSNFKRTLKNPVIYVTRKTKQTAVLIFSKEFLVAAVIFSESRYIKPSINPSIFPSSKAYSCVIKSDNLRFLNSPPSMTDYILKLKGGANEWDEKQQARLLKSLLNKARKAGGSAVSINKRLNQILELIKPIIKEPAFWRILSELEKPVPIHLIKLSISSAGFGSFIPQPELSPMQKRVQLRMAQKNLNSSGLTKNHNLLSKETQWIQKQTKLRRAEPLYPSKVLGDSYKYSEKQLEKKGLRHLEEFGIPTKEKNSKDIAFQYQDALERLLSKPNLIIHERGTLNKNEPTINFGDPESLTIISFENNMLYEDHHFISGYTISDNAFKKFEKTGNIGISQDERAYDHAQLEIKRGQIIQEKMATESFYSGLPEDARIGNQQLREVETLRQQLEQDPSIRLTENEKSMFERADKYQEYRENFYQDNPDLGKGAF